ncbi:hypothetical protein BH11BAC2_BH11BAC2_26180 [soil metagenome]
MKWTLDAAYQHLLKDQKLKKIILHTGKLKMPVRNNLYEALLVSVVSQQLSVKAADTIWSRVLALFPEEQPHPLELLKLKDDQLRTAGLSWSKASYLKNIAQFSIDQTLDYRKLRKLDDETLIQYLTQIKGVGRWTSEMILMFPLNRPDVLPLDDIGIQHGMKKIYQIEGKGKELHPQMLRIAAKWTPYRTLACRHLWKYKDSIITP